MADVDLQKARSAYATPDLLLFAVTLVELVFLLREPISPPRAMEDWIVFPSTFWSWGYL